MLTENQIIEYFCTYLEENGYKIKQSLNTKEKGIDIIASGDGRNMKVEVKKVHVWGFRLYAQF